MADSWGEAVRQAADRLSFLLDLPRIVSDALGLGALLPVIIGVVLGIVAFFLITGRERPRPDPHLQARRQLDQARRRARRRRPGTSESAPPPRL